MENQIDYLDQEVDALKYPHARQADEFFNRIVKAVKAKLVYPSSSKLPEQFRNELSQKATEIFKEVEILEYKITSNTILYGETVVYESNNRSENLAHAFFRDGLISLNFLQGINDNELTRFIDLLAKMMRTVYIDDDLATLLWEENFQYITYELIDAGLDIDTVEYSGENFKPDKKASGDDIQSLFLDEGQITFDDEDFAELNDSDIRGRGKAYAKMPQTTYDFLNRIAEFTVEENEQIKNTVESDFQQDHTEYLLMVVFEILGMEKEVPGYVETLGFIGKVRDNFISLGNFAGASALLSRMHEMLGILKNLGSPRASKIESFLLESAANDKIQLITESLNRIKEIEDEDLISYLKQLPWAAIDPLLGALGELKYFKARRAVCKVLVELGRDQIDLVARGLDDERWYVVRNVVQILGEIGSVRILNYLKKTVRHEDYRVRKETLEAAAKIPTNDSIDFMILALSDPDEKIQLSSLQYLIDNKCFRAFKAIEHIIQDKKFKNRPSEQVRRFMEGLAFLGQEKALPYLKRLINKIALFSNAKDEKMRLFAIGALGLINSGEAVKILNKLTQSKNKKKALTALRATGASKRSK